MRESVSGIKHPAFRDALALTRTGGRVATGRYLVEDVKLVMQALASDAEVYAVFATPESLGSVETACNARNVPLYVLSGGLLQKLVGTGYETGSSAIAVVGQRRVSPEMLLSTYGLILCGEKIQDPRNVGVLIRTADAIGASGLLLSEDSAEPWQRQSVRSTTGSILRLPLALSPNLPVALTALREKGAHVVASSGGSASIASDTDLTVRPLVLIVGNEQDGISEGVRAASNTVVKLPMAEATGADSYNVTVAAGMLLYEAIRQAP
ncbi:MAG: RNA methyltransferase [Armatimonas sp.]